MGKQANKIRRSIDKKAEKSFRDQLRSFNKVDNPTERSDMTKQGSLITLETANGPELAMVLKFIAQSELVDYVKSHGHEIDESSEVWQHGYAVVGHFKHKEVQEIIDNQRFDDYPVLNHLIVIVDDPGSYSVVVGNAPEYVLMYTTIKEICQSDASINKHIHELLRLTSMYVMTGALKSEIGKEHADQSTESSEPTESPDLPDPPDSAESISKGDDTSADSAGD